jgi:hypothetical protein
MVHFILKAIIFDGIWHVMRGLPLPVDILLVAVACLCWAASGRRRGRSRY